MTRIQGTVAGLSLLAIGSLCAIVAAGVKGSKHDFSGQAWSEEQLCLPCHIPHDATPTEGAPLWAQSEDPAKRYIQTGKDGWSPVGSASAMCLSCHDGSTATDTFGGMTGSVRITNERALIGEGGDLSTDHPISVDYPVNDKGYWPAMQVQARGTIPLPDGKVECGSCHDVHNDTGFEYMLMEDNKGSSLCLACHNK